MLIHGKASFTIKEVRELMKLPSVGFEPLALSLFPERLSELPRTAKRLMQLLLQGAASLSTETSKSWSLDFLLSPRSFNSPNITSNQLSSITFTKNQLTGLNPFDSNAQLTPSNEHMTFPASLAFRSIGYKSEALPGMEELGLHFDTKRGIIANDQYGRVVFPAPPGQGNASIVPGMYCSGWVKRGPTGVIANTMEDAFASAAAIISDWERNAPFLRGGQGWDSLKQETISRGLRTVSWNDWRKIDDAEKERGRSRGKEREKFVRTTQMLQVLD